MVKKIVRAITDIKPDKDNPISIKANPKYGNVALGVQVLDRGKWVRFRFGHPAEEQHPQVKITQTGQEPIFVSYQACRDYVKKMQAEGISPREGQFGNLPSRYYLVKVSVLQHESSQLVNAS